MKLEFKTRNFYSDELRVLKTLKTKKEKGSWTGIKFYHFIIAAVVGGSFTYLASLTQESFWVLPFGAIAVFAFSFIVFAPYELYKLRKRHKVFLQQLNELIDKGTVNTCLINAKRIALAKEYEDEGDWFIIEYDTGSILYLWDYDYSLRKKFPCLDFEIYEEDFFKMLGRQVYPLSPRIAPFKINTKAKWNYMGKVGAAEHLVTEEDDFDKLMEEINSYA